MRKARDECSFGPVVLLVLELCVLLFSVSARGDDPNPSRPGPDVVISEVLAKNENGLEDEDGDTPGWIEIHNRGSRAVDLGGWSLSGGPRLPFRWAFPPVVLGPDQYLVVFASGKDRRPTSGEPLHTKKFRFRPGTSSLRLLAPDPDLLPVMELHLPEQRLGHSHQNWGCPGRLRGGDRNSPGGTVL